MAGYREDWFNNNESNHGWYTCVRCGKKLRKGDVDIDHIIPQNKGGRHDLKIYLFFLPNKDSTFLDVFFLTFLP